MKFKTSELTGAALDWAVAKCEGEDAHLIKGQLETRWTENGWAPSANWSQGGPIIERERIQVFPNNGATDWSGVARAQRTGYVALLVSDGQTPLIAAMRCYVASKLGDVVDIPEEIAK